jgi:hypothetical protein
MARFHAGYPEVEKFADEAMKVYFKEGGGQDAMRYALAKFVGDLILAAPTYSTALKSAGNPTPSCNSETLHHLFSFARVR